MAESRQYLDDKGRKVLVDSMLGGRAWGSFREISSSATRGITYVQVRSPLLPPVKCRAEADRNLELYARHRKGWMRIPTAEETRDLLLLVRSYEVPLSKIETWTDVERARVCAWAGAVHLRASDNIVQVPETPALVAILDHLHGRGGRNDD